MNFHSWNTGIKAEGKQAGHMLGRLQRMPAWEEIHRAEPWIRGKKGFISHTGLGKPLPYGPSVSLCAKTSKSHLHVQDCCEDE